MIHYFTNSRTTKALWLLLAVPSICGWACGSEHGMTSDAVNGVIVNPLVVASAGSKCSPNSSAPFDLGAITFTGDTATVLVSYQGGCERHVFTPCWDGSFQTINPERALVVLSQASNDVCTAEIVDQQVAIDLTEVLTQYLSMNSMDHGEIEISVVTPVAGQMGSSGYLNF